MSLTYEGLPYSECSSQQSIVPDQDWDRCDKSDGIGAECEGAQQDWRQWVYCGQANQRKHNDVHGTGE